jgi:hypothetical protein
MRSLEEKPQPERVFLSLLALDTLALVTRCWSPRSSCCPVIREYLGEPRPVSAFALLLFVLSAI